MKTFEELVTEATEADVEGWGFGWLDGRATEARPPWGYAKLLAQRLKRVNSALDLDTGGGEVLSEMPVFPEQMFATEAWPPNIAQARARLSPRGVTIVDTSRSSTLPFADATFELVTARHPVAPDWPEIYRVLKPGGHYFAQHVGPASAFELIEYFLGPLPVERALRHADKEAQQAAAAGLQIVDIQSMRCPMAFYDIGAVVWILRKCVWWVPDFSVEKYHAQLKALDARMRSGTPFIAHSSRHLIEARR